MPLAGHLQEYRKPSFSEQLARGLPGAINESAQGVGQLIGAQQHKKALSEFYNKNYGQDLSVLPEKERENYINQLGKVQQQNMAAQLKQKESAQAAQTAIGMLQQLKDLKSYTGSQASPFSPNFDPTQIGLGKYISPAINRDAVQKRSTIDAAGPALADLVYTTFLANKGTISKEKIEKLMKPYMVSSNDSEREYQGKIDALEFIVGAAAKGLDPEQIESHLSASKEKSSGMIGSKKVKMEGPDGKFYAIPEDKMEWFEKKHKLKRVG